MNIYIFF